MQWMDPLDDTAAQYKQTAVVESADIDKLAKQNLTKSLKKEKI